MDIISAYQQVGSYRGAAELCGTTHKTVKRVVEQVRSRREPHRRGLERARNYDAVAELVAERVAKSAGPDLGEADVADRPRRRLRGFGAELPPTGRRSESVVAQRESPGPPPGGVVTG